MTIIVFDGHTLAGDKQSTNYGANHNLVTKVFKVHGHLLGVSGQGDLAFEMVEWFKAGRKREDFPRPYEDQEATLLVVTPERKILMYTTRATPIPYEQGFAAIGCGRDYALAALYLGCDAKRAVEVACHFDVNCGGGIDTVSLDE